MSVSWGILVRLLFLSKRAKCDWYFQFYFHFPPSYLEDEYDAKSWVATLQH